VKYYPQLRLYRNHANGTQTTETFEGSRSLENMETWLDERVPRSALPPHDHPVPVDQTALTSTAVYNPDGVVKALGSRDFQDAVAKEPTIVKFYAPWCGHCQKLAPSEWPNSLWPGCYDSDMVFLFIFVLNRMG